MTQPDAFISPASQTPPAKTARTTDLWIAGAVVLGVVFLPALVAGVVSLLIH